MKPRLAALAAIAAVATMLVAGAGTAATAAIPSADATQAEIDALLAKNPGATRTGTDTVAVRSGVVVKVGLNAKEDCPTDAICLWMDQFFTGQMVIIYPYVCDAGIIIDLKDLGFNDRASSWKNNTTRRLGTTYWHHGGAGGVLWRMYPYLEAPTLPAEFNDEASSVGCTNLF